jgi:hypothetical protein
LVVEGYIQTRKNPIGYGTLLHHSEKADSLTMEQENSPIRPFIGDGSLPIPERPSAAVAGNVFRFRSFAEFHEPLFELIAGKLIGIQAENPIMACL